MDLKIQDLRRCKGCGTTLTDEHVMKIKFEDDSWETIYLDLCPECFKKQLRKIAGRNLPKRKLEL